MMGGDGQSVLAIVQSLRDAGLLVTVVDRKYGGSTATAVLAINGSPRLNERRSLGINTRLKSTQHSSTQASGYAGVYELAHGGRKPVSQSVHLPEFPPQRASPNPIEGNFVVPGWRTSECQYTPVRSSRSCRGNLHWTDRVGSVYRSEDTSAFAHSLRKYPNLSPNRSLSTELVQRLLTYTQNKRYSKSTYRTHNDRRKPPSPNTRSEIPKKSSKDVQTYTRTKPERSENVINTPSEINCKEKYTEKSRLILKDKYPGNQYDYLKRTKPRGWNTRGTEVRYLTDVTKCIKDALRNICDEAPVMYPNVESRYTHHRRMHHLQTNGQSTSTYNTHGEATTPDGNSPCSTVQCPPNNARAKVRNRCSQHKKHQHCGQKSCSDLNNIEIQASPPASREASVMARSDSSTALPHECPASVKTCCLCKRPLPCHCRSETDRKIEKDVLDWMKEIPVFSDDTKDNRYLRCMLSKKLVENLQKMIKDGNLEKIREEIDKCLNVLPMWSPESDKDKTIFKNQIAENLMNRIKKFTEKDFLKEQNILWFNELPFNEQIKPGDREKYLDSLISRLKAVERVPNDGAYKEALKNEIIKVLNEIPGIDKGDIKLMANKLVDNLVHVDTKDKAIDNVIRKKICEWIDNTSELTENGFYAKDNFQVIDDLAKILTEVQDKWTDEVKIKELMKNKTEDWLEIACKGKNVLLDMNIKSKLAQELIDQIYPIKTKSLADQYVKSIFDWLKDTPELSNCLKENILVEKFAKELQELKNKGYDDDALYEVIVNWINEFCKMNGINIDSKSVRELAEKLMDKLKLRKNKPRKLAKKIEETISEEVSRILENDSLSLNSKVKKNLQNKITNILSNSIENVLSNESTNAKKDLIKLLQHEGNMTPEEAKDLANTVIDSTKTISLTEERKKPSTKSMKRGIKREGEESGETDVAYKEDLEETISDVLPDEIIRGTKTENIKDDIYNFLDETDLPRELSHSVSPKLVKENREMSFESSRQDFTRTSTSPRQNIALTPVPINVLKQNVERTVLNFIDDVLVDHRPDATANIRTSAKTFVDNVSQSLQTNEGKESVFEEVNFFLNSIPISCDTTRKELADELTRRLFSTGFQTSTPRKDISFQPRRLTFDTSLPSVNLDDKSVQPQRRNPEEDNYREDITKVVQNWLDRMPLSLNENEAKRFKDIVVAYVLM